MSALVVNAGDYVKANISIQNIGQQIGTFRVRSIVVPDGGGVNDVKQRFFNAIGYNPTHTPPAGAEIGVSGATLPNTTAVVVMYSDQWADGNPLKYASQQIFDTIFEVTVVETSEIFNFRGENVLQHQTLAPAKPNIIGVDLVIQVPTGMLIQ